MPIVKNNKVLLTQDEKRRIEDDATFLLDTAGIKKPPIPIFEVVRSAIPNSKITLVKDTPRGIKGITFFGNGICDIFINENYSEQVQRFTAGHELGHALEKESGCRLKKGIDPLVAEFQERRAEYWSACLLMPKWMLNSYWALAPSLDVSDLDRVKIRIDKLASIFEVSYLSMLIQLKEFKLIPLTTYFGLWREYRDNWIDWSN